MGKKTSEMLIDSDGILFSSQSIFNYHQFYYWIVSNPSTFFSGIGKLLCPTQLKASSVSDRRKDSKSSSSEADKFKAWIKSDLLAGK